MEKLLSKDLSTLKTSNLKDLLSLKELPKKDKIEMSREKAFNKATESDKQLMLHYDFDELLTVEQLELNDIRHHKETFLEKCMSIQVEKLDMEAYDELYKVLFKAIKKRYLIILNLENIPALLNNALDCQCKGVSCYTSNLAIHAKLREINQLLRTKEVVLWLHDGHSDLDFSINADTKMDYIETYQKVIRQITDIRGENLDFVKDIIHNEKDVLEDEILANSTFEFDTYYEDTLSEDEEEVYLD